MRKKSPEDEEYIPPNLCPHLLTHSILNVNIIYPRLKERFLCSDCQNGTLWKDMVKLMFIASMKKILPLVSSGNPKSNGIITGPQIRDLMMKKNFNALLKGTEKLLGKHFK